MESGDEGPDEGQDRVGASDGGERENDTGVAVEDPQEPPHVGDRSLEEAVELPEIGPGDAAEAEEEAPPPLAPLDQFQGPAQGPGDLGEDAADRSLVEGGGGEPDSGPEHAGDAVDLFRHVGAVGLESAGVVDRRPYPVR